MKFVVTMVGVGFALSISASALAQVTRHVDLNDGEPNPDASFDGSEGWDSDAYKYLQDALDDADTGDIIFVSAGHHYPDKGLSQTEDDETSTFVIPDGVTIYGGFEGVSGEDGPEDRDIFTHITILDGAIGTGLNSFHVVKINDAFVRPILNGLTIANGLASETGTLQNVGGGMLANGGFVAVNCIFEDNLAHHQGGAVYIAYLNFGAYFSNCVFRRNTAASSGSNSGGAVAIADDTSITDHGPITFVNCLFHDNDARTLAACIFQGTNHETALHNCTFADNATSDGSGLTVHVRFPADFSVTNCIFWGNGDDGETIASQGDPDDDEMLFIFHTVLQEIPSSTPDGWVIHGTSVVDIDPVFVDEEADDYHLDAASPVINAGGPAGIPDTYDVDDDGIMDGPTGEQTPDLDLQLRVAECFIDLGPYEDRPAASCDFDLNDDGAVNGYDLAILLAAWGACPTSGACPADFNCDRVVNGQDLALLLGGWTLAEDYPRSCDSGESSAMGGGSESEPDTAALDEVLAALGLQDHDEFIVWLQLVGIEFAAAEIEQILSE